MMQNHEQSFSSPPPHKRAINYQREMKRCFLRQGHHLRICNIYFYLTQVKLHHKKQISINIHLKRNVEKWKRIWTA